jgi:hypothetical protein
VENNESIEKEKNDDSEPRKLNIENTNTIGNEPIVELEISKHLLVLKMMLVFGLKTLPMK